MIIKWSIDDQPFQGHKMISFACFFVCFWSDDHQMINRWSRDQSICVLQCCVLITHNTSYAFNAICATQVMLFKLTNPFMQAMPFMQCMQCQLCIQFHLCNTHNAHCACNAICAIQTMPISHIMPYMQYTQCPLCMQCHMCNPFMLFRKTMPFIQSIQCQ